MALVEVYKYYAQDKAPWRFLYSTNKNDPGFIKDGWVQAPGIAFNSVAKTDVDAVPVYRYYTTLESVRFAYSRKNNDPEFINGGWINEGTAFYAYAGNGAKRLPVYRLVSAEGIWRHQYVLPGHPALTETAWINEGPAFYVPA